MRGISEISVMVLAVAVLIGAAPRPAEAARCEVVVGTGSGVNKGEAVVKSRSALEEEIPQRVRRWGWRGVSVRPHRTRPYPFFKEREITPDIMVRPDVVSARAYTRCWTGVVSPFVCSSGARVCGR